MFGISVIYIITRFLKVVKCDVNYKKEEKKCKFLCFVPCIVVKDIFQEEKGGDTVDDSDIVKLFLERNEQVFIRDLGEIQALLLFNSAEHSRLGGGRGGVRKRHAHESVGYDPAAQAADALNVFREDRPQCRH